MDVSKRKKLARALAARGKTTSEGAGTSAHPAPESTLPTSPTSHTQALPTSTPSQDLPSPHATQTPTSPAPISTVPLTMVETATTPAPLGKGKGVVVIPSRDDEDTEDGPNFKRRRTIKVVTSHSASNHSAESQRELPPSASSPPHQLASGNGVESAPTPTPALAPELPQLVQHLLRGFLHQATPGGPTGKAVEEGIAYSFREYLSHACSWREQAEAKASDRQVLENELALLKEQTKTQERRWFHQEVAYQDTLKEAQKAKEEANKRLHEAGQKYVELLGQTVPLRVEIAELKDAIEASKSRTKDLEDRCVSKEVNWGKVEGALAARTEAFDLLKIDFSKL